MGGSQGRPPPRWIRRIWRAARRSVPWLVWLVAIGAAVLLADRQAPTFMIHAIAEKRTQAVLAPTSGNIAFLTVDARQFVEADAVVAMLDGADLDLQVRAVQTAIQRLEAEVSRRVVQLDEREGDVEFEALVEHRRLAREREVAELELLQTQAGLEEDQIELHGIEIDLERERVLLDKGLSDEAGWIRLGIDRDRMESRIENAAARVAQQEIHVAAAQSRQREFAEAQSERIRMRVEEECAPLRLDMVAQRIELDRVKRARELLSIRAPVSGRIDQRFVHSGGHIRAGDPVVTILIEQPDSIVAYVPERSSGHLEAELTEGAIARITSESAPGEFFEVPIATIGSAIVQIPERLWAFSQVPEYGLPVHLHPPTTRTTRPGELFHVEFGLSGSPVLD